MSSEDGSPVRPSVRPDRGNLIVVSAPSGAGKSSLVQRALRRVEGLRFSVSYTTRAPRSGEREGIEYSFVSVARFEQMCSRDEFLEWAEVHGNLYGTHRGAVEEMLTNGLDVILDIDVQGAEQVRRQLSDAATVFILPPSKAVLRSRLELRNQNSANDLDRRIRAAAIEVQLYERFDYVIINDDLDRAASELEAIIAAERRRPQRNRNRIEQILGTFGGD